MADSFPDNYDALSRRDALKMALAAAGGLLTGANLHAAAAELATRSSDQPKYFSEGILYYVERVCDILLPETDTPGALAAGVPAFLDLLLANWASPASQSRFSAGLESVEQQALERFASSLPQLEPELQHQVLSEVDRTAMSTAGHPFRLVKKLVIFGYYTSEVGASQELRIDPVPGAYGCTPAEEDERAWATNRWRNDL